MDPAPEQDEEFDDEQELSPEELERRDLQEIEDFHKTYRPLYDVVIGGFLEINKKQGDIPFIKKLEYIVKNGGHTEQSVIAFRYGLSEFLPVLKALNTADCVDIPLSNYANEPSDSSTLLSINRFMLFGLDFKITPDREIKLIEINGLNSGMKGYAKNRIDAETNAGILRADRAVNKHFSLYGKRELAYIGSVLAAIGTPSWRISYADELIRLLLKDNNHSFEDKLKGNVNEKWLTEIHPITKHLDTMEGLTKNKAIMDLYCDEVRDIKPFSMHLSSKAINQIFEEQNCEYVVVKPTDGSIGKDLIFISKDKVPKETIPKTISYIVEPFIPSAPIYCKETSDMHGGCMRYVVIAEENKDGELKLHHFGGYWRLCPTPMNGYGHTNAMRANLHQGAKLVPLIDADEELAHMAAEKVLTSVWPKFMDGGIRIFEAFLGQD